jgi:hypothetical protein
MDRESLANSDLSKEQRVTRKRSKIASIVLFLAALVVGFDAQPGWGIVPVTGYIACDIATGFPGGTNAVGGMVVLPDGTVLVAQLYTGIYSFKPGSGCLASTPTLLSTSLYLGMAIGNDGQVYANAFDGTGNVYIVSPTTGLPTSTVLTGVFGLGMALDPLTGDLYVTRCDATTCAGPDIRYITGVYGHHPTIHNFRITVTGARFDGLAWSCDGTRLAAVSLSDEVFQFDRGAVTKLDKPVPTGTMPDGVAFGADGTPFAGYPGYFFVNNANGTVSKIANDGSTYDIIASCSQSGCLAGDFVAVDTKGNLLLTQVDRVTRLSTTASGTPGTSGGQWVLPGSTLCGDLGCGAKAATTTQFGIPSPAAPHPCLSGLNAGLVLTLSQSACVDCAGCAGCAGCATLNQARSTLLDLLNSLDPPRHCLDLLKSTLTNLYLACPCNCPCPSNDPNCNPSITALSGGTCLAQTKFPLGIDLESYDPILQAFMRRVMSP